MTSRACNREAARARGSQALLLTFEPVCDVTPVIVRSQPTPGSDPFYATCISWLPFDFT